MIAANDIHPPTMTVQYDAVARIALVAFSLPLDVAPKGRRWNGPVWVQPYRGPCHLRHKLDIAKDGWPPR